MPELHGPVVVYGASGYTGRLVAEELDRRGVPMILSGRNEESLGAVASTLRGPARVQPAVVDDPGALRKVLCDAAAVINCAGPFHRTAIPVAEAAVFAGCHYVDTTAEQRVVATLYRQLDEPARRASRAVLPSMAFYCALGDLLAAMVARGLGPLDDLVVAYQVSGWRLTRGSRTTALEFLRERVDHVNGTSGWTARPPSTRLFNFPAPTGRTRVVDYPVCESVTAPRHIETGRVTGLMTTRTLAPPVLGWALPIGFAFGALIGSAGLGQLANALVARLPERTTRGERSRSQFTIVVTAVAGNRHRTGVVRGSDIYGISAPIAVEATERLLTGVGVPSGALAPAQAVDPASFLNSLGERIAYEVEAEPHSDAGESDSVAGDPRLA